MSSLRAAVSFCLLLVVLVSAVTSAHSHPMGNFSINHYSRIEIHADAISIRYIIDMAEIPTVSERAGMDTDGDGKISEAERDAYLDSTAIRLRNGITLRLNGKQVVPSVKPVGLEFMPGAGWLLTTRITLDAVAKLTHEHFENAESVDYHDGNYDVRTGWKEIVLAPDMGLRIEGSNASQTDLSRQLTVYPADATVAPPQQTEAHFVIRTDQRAGAPPTPHSGAAADSTAKQQSSHVQDKSAYSSGNTPRDAFTQAITRGNLTPGMIFVALLIAFAFGALHALSPGHGKAMMAAYLVGARGTARHVVLLGLVVTLTHTIGVFALGLVMLFAARYIVPERLYPALSALSGLTIVGMGAILLRQRWPGLSSIGMPDDHSSPADIREYENIPLPDRSSNAISRTVHPDSTTTTNRGPLSVRSLVTLGITGGILPCPSALVVMLSAVALHRVVLGLILIVAFSVGLAVILTSIGLCVVYMRVLTERISTRGKLVQRLPVMSAAFVMLIGLFLIFKSLRGGGY